MQLYDKYSLWWAAMETTNKKNNPSILFIKKNNCKYLFNSDGWQWIIYLYVIAFTNERRSAMQMYNDLQKVIFKFGKNAYGDWVGKSDSIYHVRYNKICFSITLLIIVLYN
mgnify:CR=1 FL=1